MRKLALAVFGTLFGLTAYGQDLLECVNPDVLRGLIFRNTAAQATVISERVPDEISGIDVPTQFSWIGSAERNLGAALGNAPLTSVTAAYRTSMTADAARAAAIDALARGGWEIQTEQMGIGNGVFTSASQPVSQTACRDNQPVSVTASTLNGRTYVLYGIARGGNSTACDARMRPSVMSGTGLEEYMPTLELPADPVTGAPARMQGSGGGGGGSGRNLRVEFTLDDSVGNVANHFARQMADQGWTADTRWTGTTTAGSSWSKQTAADATVLGTLQVTAVDDAQFTVVLHVVQL